jgi:hypothetical protein
VQARGGYGGGDHVGEPDRSGVPVGRGEGDARQAGPARQRENGEGAEERRTDGPGERWPVRARGRKEGKKGRGRWAGGARPGCQGEKERRERRKGAGWAGPKGEKRVGGKKKEEEQMLLNLNMKIEFKLKSN